MISGGGGISILYLVANGLVNHLSSTWRSRLQPFIFVGPALAVLSWYLLLPTLRTLYLSFFNANSAKFNGIENYIFAFTDRVMLTAFRNNLLWLIIGTGGATIFGLVIALLADRSRFEKIAESFIFLPMAISFIGAGVIWKFVYAFKPAGVEQIGLLNAVVVALGGEHVGWFTIRPWNTFFLIVILIWMWTGYSMVLHSAAIKGVPKELIEAGRIDGAGEIRIVLSIVIPYISGTIVTVPTTILIVTLKIFDIVFSMTNGLYGTEVIASQQYKQIFKFLHYGRGSAIAMILFIAVIPVI